MLSSLNSRSSVSLRISLRLLLLLLALLLMKSQILLGIEFFPAFAASLDFMDFTVPDEILGAASLT